MSDLLLGFLSGALLMLIINSWMHDNYKKILIMKSKDKSAEFINGKFYYIIPEEEIVNENRK